MKVYVIFDESQEGFNQIRGIFNDLNLAEASFGAFNSHFTTIYGVEINEKIEKTWLVQAFARSGEIINCEQVDPNFHASDQLNSPYIIKYITATSQEEAINKMQQFLTTQEPK